MCAYHRYVVSCIPYVKPKAMKEELNGLFLAKHGDWLEDREVTLSKVYVCVCVCVYIYIYILCVCVYVCVCVCV